jgi:hypothetical protein
MTSINHTTRRAVLTALPLAGAAAVLPNVGAAESKPDNVMLASDAVLLALGAEFEALWTVEREIADRDGDVDADFEAAREDTEAVVRQMAGIEPQTLAGLKILARACTWLDSDDYWAIGTEHYEYELRQQVIGGVTRLL